MFSGWRGLTGFGPDGRYASSSPYRLPPGGDCRSVEGGEEYLLPDGSILLGFSVFVGLNSDHEECPKPSEAQPPVVIGRYVPTTGVFDTIAELPGEERTYEAESRYAYAKNLVVGSAHNRVYLGDTGSDTILVMSFSGDTIAAFPVPFEPAPVPADAREKLFQEEVFTSGVQSMTLRWTFIYPDHYPRYARLVAAPENRVWVMAYPPLKEPVFPSQLEDPAISHRLDGGARWRVVGRDGLPIAELQTPPGVFLLEVGDDYVLGLHKDELERESVQVYRLIR